MNIREILTESFMKTINLLRRIGPVKFAKLAQSIFPKKFDLGPLGYVFTTKIHSRKFGSRELKIEFGDKGFKRYEIVWEIDGSIEKKTKNIDPAVGLAVMTEVVDSLLYFLAAKKPNEVTFAAMLPQKYSDEALKAALEFGGEQNHRISRARTYTHFVKKFSPELEALGYSTNINLQLENIPPKINFSITKTDTSDGPNILDKSSWDW
jgi:hypothetical protein